MNKLHSVLFVCTGNSCRSIMAEGLLKKKLSRLGKDYITVESAGTKAADGFTPTNETITLMKEEGIDVAGFKSKRLTEEMIKTSDLILVMQPMHRDEAIRKVPEAASKTYLLTEFAKKGQQTKESDESSIPDPIGMSIDYYRHCLGLIKKEIERISELLC